MNNEACHKTSRFLDISSILQANFICIFLCDMMKKDEQLNTV